MRQGATGGLDAAFLARAEAAEAEADHHHEASVSIQPRIAAEGERDELADRLQGVLNSAERVEVENYELRLFITGSEDAPGFASSLSADTLRRIMRNSRQAMRSNGRRTTAVGRALQASSPPWARTTWATPCPA